MFGPSGVMYQSRCHLSRRQFHEFTSVLGQFSAYKAPVFLNKG